MKRSPSEIIKRGYTDEEVSHVYELGRKHLENGFIRKAERVFKGLISVVPDYVPALLGLAYVYHYSENAEQAEIHAKKALQIDPMSVEAMLFNIVFLLSSGDFNTAGMYLGEIREKIESGIVNDPKKIRLYKSQIARFQLRR